MTPEHLQSLRDVIAENWLYSDQAAAIRAAVDEIPQLETAAKVAVEAARLAALELAAVRETSGAWFATAQEQARTIADQREELELLRPVADGWPAVGPREWREKYGMAGTVANGGKDT